MINLFSEPVKALQTIWCIGDVFLHDIKGTLQTLKTSEAAQQGRKLFIHMHFNFESFAINPLSPVKPSAVRIYNALVQALNAYQHLPDYIIIIPDKDIIESIHRYDFGTRALIESNINWLIKNVAHAIMDRREQLKKLRPGAAPKSLPPIYWIKMLQRPITDLPQYKAIWTQRSKFNSALDTILTLEKYMAIFAHQQMDDRCYFDICGKLTTSGEFSYWCELDSLLKDYFTKKSSTSAAASSTSSSERRTSTSGLSEQHRTQTHHHQVHPFCQQIHSHFRNRIPAHRCINYTDF